MVNPLRSLAEKDSERWSRLFQGILVDILVTGQMLC